MSIKRVSAGDGYRYLIQSVAAGDGAVRDSTALTRYYAESGNPPGQWLGTGLHGLNGGEGIAAGSEVSEEQMFRLFGMGSDPVSGEQLGNRPYRIDGSGRAPVAGFDLTFSTPKSVSAWWGITDAGTQQAIVDAHRFVVEACVAYLEREVAATRIGRNGVAQAEVRGLIGAAFNHWDSRLGDPQLHTHLVIANRVQGLDGEWRTLDSRALYRSVVAVSELYNALLADELTSRLGVEWEARSRRPGAAPAWEIADVPRELIAEFSQRSRSIDAHSDALVRRFRIQHGRDPSSTEVLRLRQQATLATRPDKQLHSLAELCDQWRDRASDVLSMDAQAWAKGVGMSGRVGHAAAMTEDELGRLGTTVVAAVEAKRATWSRWNLHAEASRQLMGRRFAGVADRLEVTERVVDRAIANSVLLTAPALADVPQRFRRADGRSMFAHRHAETYTSRALLEAEGRLLDAGRDQTGPTVELELVSGVVAVPPPTLRYRLGSGQVAAVTEIATSGRVVDVLVGPAGTGKTAALAGLRAAWDAQFGCGSVVGLAPSANAADVLAGELGIDTENTAKWLTEHDREPDRLADIDRWRALLHRATAPGEVAQRRIDELTAEVDRWRLQRGQLVVIDEASLAGTIALARIVTHASEVGAKVLLVGDPAQLSAVDAGGAFAMLVRDRSNPPELTAVRRFANRWERSASRRLRVADPTVLDVYEEHGRIHGGPAAAMADAAYRAWLEDEAVGRRSLLIAGDSGTVAELNARARADLVASGRVHGLSVPLADGTVAGEGDRIVTRRNDRSLATGRGFVKNGDVWIVAERGSDGSLTVQRPTGGPAIRLPKDYVAAHVDLGYATTAYRAQGLTVDSAHAVVGTGMTREALYVALTRGRGANHAYVTTEMQTELCTPGDELTARDVLTAVLRRVGGDVAAHDELRAEQDRAASVGQLADEYETIAAAAHHQRWMDALATSGLTRSQLEAVTRSPAFGALTAALRRAEACGQEVRQALPQLVASRGLVDAGDVAAVLHERVTRWSAARDRSDVRDGLIAGLIPRLRNVREPASADALRDRELLIEQRADATLSAAIRTREPWLRTLGDPPPDPLRRAEWLSAARTVAAFRDRYGDDTRRPTPDETHAVRAAIRTAAAIAATAERGPDTDLSRPMTREI